MRFETRDGVDNAVICRFLLGNSGEEESEDFLREKKKTMKIFQ